MFNLINLIIVDITSQILFYYLIESFYLSVRLKMKNCGKLVVHSEFRGKSYKKSKSKDCAFVYYKLV